MEHQPLPFTAKETGKKIGNGWPKNKTKLFNYGLQFLTGGKRFITLTAGMGFGPTTVVTGFLRLGDTS